MFLRLWIRTGIRIPKPDPDLEDPWIRIWIRNTVEKRYTVLFISVSKAFFSFCRFLPRRAGLAGASPRHAAVRPPAAAATAPEPHHAQCGAAQLPLPLTAELPPPLLRRPALRPDRLLPHLWHLRVAVCAGRCQRIRRPGDAFQQWERDVGAAAGCSFAAPFRPQARVVVQCGVQHDGRRR